MSDLSDERLVSMAEAVKFLGVTSQTLYNWEKKGKIKPERIGFRRDRKYRLKDLKQLRFNWQNESN